MLRDQIALLSALGYRSTAMMVGHDQGSQIAGLGALIRPDMFPRLTLIGGGFGGPPAFPFNTAKGRPRRIRSLPTPNSTRRMPSSIRRGDIIRITGQAPRRIAI